MFIAQGGGRSKGKEKQKTGVVFENTAVPDAEESFIYCPSVRVTGDIFFGRAEKRGIKSLHLCNKKEPTFQKAGSRHSGDYFLIAN